MVRALATLTVAALVALTASAADEKYASKEGQYAVQFPDAKSVKTEAKKSGGAAMEFASVGFKGNEYMVMYMELPPGAAGVPPKTLLDAGEKGGVAQSGGKLLTTKDFEFGKDKLPGREFVVEKGDIKAASRIILTKTRLYVVTVTGPKDFATSKEATAFLDSFQITK